MKIFAFIYKYRKAINLVKIGKALKWFFTHPILVKSMPYIAFIQRFVLIPIIIFAFTAAGWCNSTLYLLKTKSIYGALGIMFLFVEITVIEVFCLHKATPKIKVNFSISLA